MKLKEPWERHYDLKGVDRLFISFSGGLTSGLMLWILQRECKLQNVPFTVAFANTGQENEETLEFVDRCSQEFEVPIVWLEAVINPELGQGTRHRIVDFESASRNGEPFEDTIAKYCMPTITASCCSRELKTGAINSFQKTFNEKRKYTAIGIRADEFDRVPVDAKWKLYPLINLGIQRSDVNRFWSKMPFTLNLRDYQGNCKWCFKKSLRKLLTIMQETPQAFDFPRRMEQKYQYHTGDTNKTPPLRFFRGNRTVADLEALAKLPFKAAKDRSNETETVTQPSLLDLELDTVSGGCSESCEAFLD